MAAAEALHEELRAAGLRSLLTIATRGRARSSPTPSCSACPLRLTVGRRSLAAGTAEAKVRRGMTDIEGGVPLTGGGEAVRKLWADLP